MKNRLDKKNSIYCNNKYYYSVALGGERDSVIYYIINRYRYNNIYMYI
jgi:hypothetical protein